MTWNNSSSINHKINLTKMNPKWMDLLSFEKSKGYNQQGISKFLIKAITLSKTLLAK